MLFHIMTAKKKGQIKHPRVKPHERRMPALADGFNLIHNNGMPLCGFSQNQTLALGQKANSVFH